jgi:hypothetical protein
VLTWLIPINTEFACKSTLDFDPSMFIQGPAEEYPRSLESMEFVCRLTDLSSKYKTNDICRNNLQYKNELILYKFEVNDMTLWNKKLYTNQCKNNNFREQDK